MGPVILGYRRQDQADHQQQSGRHGAGGVVERAGAHLALQGNDGSLRFQRRSRRSSSWRWSKSPRRPKNYVSFICEVQAFFEDDTAVISTALADAGELTQGLCSPWQNDYRECSCYYWASARPDYVNVELGPNGLSTGDNWMQKERSDSYVADDYADTRLLMYDDLFAEWETAAEVSDRRKDADAARRRRDG